MTKKRRTRITVELGKGYDFTRNGHVTFEKCEDRPTHARIVHWSNPQRVYVNSACTVAIKNLVKHADKRYGMLIRLAYDPDKFYYCVLVRDEDGQWCTYFGSYDKASAQDEQQYHDGGTLLIKAQDGDEGAQYYIDQQIEYLNKAQHHIDQQAEYLSKVQLVG
jgi:hypothetical protein